jgi:hypothetical protein
MKKILLIPLAYINEQKKHMKYEKNLKNTKINYEKIDLRKNLENKSKTSKERIWLKVP